MHKLLFLLGLLYLGCSNITHQKNEEAKENKKSSIPVFTDSLKIDVNNYSDPILISDSGCNIKNEKIEYIWDKKSGVIKRFMGKIIIVFDSIQLYPCNFQPIENTGDSFVLFSGTSYRINPLDQSIGNPTILTYIRHHK